MDGAAGDIAMMGARAARAGVTLQQVDALDNFRKSIVADAAWQHRTDHDYLAELTTWSGRYASTARVPARSAPQPDATVAIPAPVIRRRRAGSIALTRTQLRTTRS